jgi:hypothetical protein
MTGCNSCAGFGGHHDPTVHDEGRGIADDVRRAFDLLQSQPMQPHMPLLSPRCGLHDEHARCHSAICECTCHYADPH